MFRREDDERRRAREQAVDEEYQKLDKFHVDRRRVVFTHSDYEHSGSYGIVRQAELHQSAYLPPWLASRQYGPPQLVAVKQFKLGPDERISYVKRAFTKEMLVWSSLESHPGIAKFLGFYADFKRSEAWLLSPWEPYGNISEFVHRHELEVPEKLSLVYDTIDALTFLHQQNPPVCHGDIKSTNVLVSANFRAILYDFGLARLYEDSGFGRLETSTGFKGSIRWCSPEVINGEPRIPASDVYSWAWLVWEIMTGELPYEGTSADYVIIRKIFESPRPQVDGESRLSDCLQVWELMIRCWDVDPRQRPTANMCKTVVIYLPRCIPIPNDSDHQIPMRALLENLGVLESWKGSSTESFAYLDRVLRLYQKEGDLKGVASVLRKQAAAWHRDSDFRKAFATASAALEHCRGLNDALGIADALFWLGSALISQDKWDEALPSLRESLDIYRTHGNDVGAIQCLERIGEVQRMSWDNNEALSTLDECVTLASHSGDRLGLAKALVLTGVTHWDMDDSVKAMTALSEGSTIARKVGWEPGLSAALETMGRIKMQEGEHHGAEELFQESVSVARHCNHRWRLARGLEELGICFQSQGRLHEAAQTLEESYVLYQDMLQYRESVRAASTLAELKRSQKEWYGALFWYDRIIALRRIQEHRWGTATDLELKGEILLQMKRYDEAALNFEAATVVRIEEGLNWRSNSQRLCAIPKIAMQWERRLPLLCDTRRLQRRLPQLVTASLKLPIPVSHRES